MIRRRPQGQLHRLGLLLCLVIMAACAAPKTAASPSSSTTNQSTVASTGANQKPAPTEQVPTGDIPDTQAFVSYHSAPGGYQLDTPEGWARTTKGPDVTLTSKLDGMSVTKTTATSAPTAASARTNQVAQLEKSGQAAKVTNVQDVTLPSGPAVRISYESNSPPDSVTGKQVRLENDAYLYFKNGKLATLRLWAPLGADNVDQWRRISQSFQWR